MRRVRRAWVACLALVAGGAVWGQDNCNESPPQDAGGRDRAPMQYCFDVVDGQGVLWLYGSIGPDSAAHVSRGLRQTGRYREVWLNSGGGLVDEGFRIGFELRRLKATVRVPRLRGVICASSCTNLMLGGYNRIVENGAQFYVHAKSSVMGLTAASPIAQLKSGAVVTAGDIVAKSAEDPAYLVHVVERQRRGEPESSVDAVTYFQSVLGGTPDRTLYRQFAATELPPIYGPGSSDIQAIERDRARLAADGVVALQEILTQVELRSMREMLAAMRERERELGRGARVALRVFDAMLTCRIQDVCLLSHHQLASLGYHNFDKE